MGKRELPRRDRARRGRSGAAVEGRPFLGQHVLTPLHGRRGAGQRLQLPRVGTAGEARARLPRGRPDDRQAGDADRVPHRELHRARSSTRGCCPTARCSSSPARCGDLFDHLTEQDLVSFTGSASTARQLRTHPTLTARAVRFTAEADSLNCSILGPDATPGDAGVRPLRRAARHRDDRQGRPEVHRHPAGVRARASTSTRSSRR